MLRCGGRGWPSEQEDGVRETEAVREGRRCEVAPTDRGNVGADAREGGRGASSGLSSSGRPEYTPEPGEMPRLTLGTHADILLALTVVEC